MNEDIRAAIAIGELAQGEDEEPTTEDLERGARVLREMLRRALSELEEAKAERNELRERLDDLEALNAAA